MHASLEDSLRSAVESYRAAVSAVADAGLRAYPPAGENLKQNLLQLQQNLTETASPDVLTQSGQRFHAELKTWSERASQYYRDSAEEIKALLLEVAKAAAEVGARDQRYGEHLHTLAARLEGAAKLDNITVMRQSLSSSATELASCINKMAEDGQRVVEQLRSQVSSYQKRVEEAERLASVDPLTGLSSRRVVERQLERRVMEAAPFSVIYFDLNEFKRINDTLGHSAGDDLLKQFADELRQSLRAHDTVARLGGDEFVVLFDGPADAALARLDLIRNRVNGDYTLATGGGQCKVPITVAAGAVAWKLGTSAQQLLDAADRAMYQDKKRTSERKPAPVAAQV